MTELARRVAGRFKKAVRVIRPPRFLDLAKMAQELDRFEFLLHFVAYKTRDARGRSLTGGMQVRQLAGGEWQVGNPEVGEGAWEAPMPAQRVYDRIRRTPLNEYMREAEQLRVDLLTT